MGRYFNWELTMPNKQTANNIMLERHLNALGFIHVVIVADLLDIGESIVNHPVITDFTNDEWTGFFHVSDRTYYLFFKDEDDAMAAKLRWQ